jgi:hypothetical protein
MGWVLRRQVVIGRTIFIMKRLFLGWMEFKFHVLRGTVYKQYDVPHEYRGGNPLCDRSGTLGLDTNLLLPYFVR